VRRIYSTPEYRLVVPGRAISFRSSKCKEYKRLIRRAARPLFPKPLPGPRVTVKLDYFHTERRRVDMDNVAKCVLDALNGIAYVDDRQVRLQGCYLVFASRACAHSGWSCRPREALSRPHAVSIRPNSRFLLIPA